MILLSILLSLLGTTPAHRPAGEVSFPTARVSASSPTAGRLVVVADTLPVASPNARQALYDQYHGYARKRVSTPPAPTLTKPTPRPARYPVSARPESTDDVIVMPKSNRTSGVSIGLRGGLTYPIFLNKLVSTTPGVGFVGGLVLITGRGAVSFQPEINYARYSTKLTSDFNRETFTAATDQVEVPLLLRFASGSPAGTRFFVNVGPYGAYVTSASIDGLKLPLGSGGRFTVGAAGGLGIALKTGSGHLTVEVRGLYPLNTANQGINNPTRTVLTQATLGYLVPLGGR